MIGLVISVLTIILFALFVEIAAIALKLTGLNIEIARFQALSALTGTGFTSQEAESVVSHPKRRKIIMVLMILGPVGFLTLISMLMISVREHVIIFHLTAVIIIVLLLLVFTRSRRFMNIVHSIVENQLRRTNIRKIGLEEVFALNKEFGVCEILVDGNSLFRDKHLNETDFKHKGFIVLAIRRDYQIITVPHAEDTIRSGDILIIFGNLKNIKNIMKDNETD
ncbi:MAG: TrkA C-terminal domain-containing protein [Candidatus Omnitrophota bacterium]